MACGVFAAGVVAGSLAMHGLFWQSAAAGDSDAVSARLHRIEDQLAIERLLMQYGAALDSRDFTAYSQLFAANGSWSGGFGTFKGPAAIKSAMEKAFSAAGAPPAAGSFHVLTNPLIEVQGDRATALSRWTFFTTVAGKPTPTLAGRYEDTLIRENGSWRFLSRIASGGAPRS
jgi:hypothetical protein